MDTKQLNEQYYQWQRENKFPIEHFTDIAKFDRWMDRALRSISPLNFKVPVEDFTSIISKDLSELSLWDCSVVFHMMETRSANDIEVGLVEYCRYLEELYKVVKVWQGIVEPKYKELQDQLQALMRANQAHEKAQTEKQVIDLSSAMTQAAGKAKTKKPRAEA